MHGGTARNSQRLGNVAKEVNELAKYDVGVDVSKHRHKACIHNLAQDSYSGVCSFDVDRQGFHKFLGTLEKFSSNKDDFLIGIEATGNYGLTLARFLLTLALWQPYFPWKTTKFSLSLIR